MGDQKIIKRLWELGHFYNPKSYHEISEENLANLNLKDKVVKDAVASFQEFMADSFDLFSTEHHNRIGIADGDIGPATEDLLEMPRCGFPDYTQEDIMLANGSGSWPVGCHPDWPDNHAFVVQVNKSGMPSFLGSRDDENSIFEKAWRAQRLAYADIGIVFVREDNNNRANTLVTFQRGRGWIGLAIVPRNPRCRDRIWAKFDTRYSPRDIVNQWARLLAHEFGHNMGMSHFRGGIMNPSIISGTFDPTEWRGDPAERTLTKWFGGIPVDLGGDDDKGSGDKFTDEDGSIYG